MGLRINNNHNSSHVENVYCAEGLVPGDLHVFTEIFWMQIFYFMVVIVTFLTFFLLDVCPTNLLKVKTLF